MLLQPKQQQITVSCSEAESSARYNGGEIPESLILSFFHSTYASAQEHTQICKLFHQTHSKNNQKKLKSEIVVNGVSYFMLKHYLFGAAVFSKSTFFREHESIDSCMKTEI